MSVSPVPREGYEDFGLKSRTGAVVGSVLPGGAAQKGGIEPGDVITEYNSRPVPNRDELVKMVIATKPGTSVPVKVLRNKQERTLHVTVDQLDLDAEQQTQRSTRNDNNPAPETQQGGGFGLTLGNVTPQIARRLQLPSGQTGALVTEVDPDGPSAGLLRAGDIIQSVNRKAGVERHRCGARAAGGRIGPHRADPHLARRQSGVRDGEEGIATDLLNRIRERGPLTVAAFMELALYDPEAGYYARAAQRSGRAGDFFTSVDVGPVFGELLEIQLAEMADILTTINAEHAESAELTERSHSRTPRAALSVVISWTLSRPRRVTHGCRQISSAPHSAAIRRSTIASASTWLKPAQPRARRRSRCSVSAIESSPPRPRTSPPRSRARCSPTSCSTRCPSIRS